MVTCNKIKLSLYEINSTEIDAVAKKAIISFGRVVVYLPESKKKSTNNYNLKII